MCINCNQSCVVTLFFFLGGGGNSLPWIWTGPPPSRRPASRALVSSPPAGDPRPGRSYPRQTETVSRRGRGVVGDAATPMPGPARRWGLGAPFGGPPPSRRGHKMISSLFLQIAQHSGYHPSFSRSHITAGRCIASRLNAHAPKPNGHSHGIVHGIYNRPSKEPPSGALRVDEGEETPCR